jgi:AcrR family transcriptional regulator
MNAARHLFAVQGPEATTVAEIADAADTAIGSFYNYFASKDELLAALLRESLAAELEQIRQLQARVEDVAEAVSVAHRHLVGMADREPDWAWLLVRLEVSHRAGTAVLGEAAVEDLERGIAEGRFDVVDPGVAIQASGGALTSVIHARLLGDLGDQAAAAHAEGVLRSFGMTAAEAHEVAHRPLPDLTRSRPGAVP